MEPTQTPAQPPQPVNPAPQPPTSTNGLAIAGFVLSFIMPLLGLILSIIGLVKAKNHNGNGKGLAIAGIIISGLFMLLSLVLIITTFDAISHRATENANKNHSLNLSNNHNINVPTSGSLTLGGVYTEKSGAYSLKLPTGWSATQTEGSTDVEAMPSDISSDYVSNLSINSLTLYPNDTLAKFVTDELDALTKYDGATIVGQNDVTINGASGHEIVAHEKNGGMLSVDYEVILLKGNLVYYLKYQTSPERGDKYLPVFKASVQSFSAH